MDKKRITQNHSRKTIQQKLQEALAKKPTASYLNSQGIPSEQLDHLLSEVPIKQHKFVQQKVKGQKKKRYSNRPTTIEPTFTRKPFEAPPTHVFETPTWFSAPNDESPVDVSIIVPCFKSKEHIIQQINSWDLEDDGLKKEIIYVDDCCPFKSHQAILECWESRRHQLKDHVGKIILTGKNSGFSFACNTGAEAASGKYLIFLNADTTVTPNWVRPMYEVFQKESNIGIVGNLHLKSEDIIDSCGSEWDWGTSSFIHSGKNIFNHKHLNQPYRLSNAPIELLKNRDVEMVTGACFMISKNLFQEIKGFDTNYRIGYWEDADLCMKAHAFGRRVYFTSESKIFHKGQHTHSGGHCYMIDNRRLFHKKWVESKIIQGLLNKKTTENQIEVKPEEVVVYTAITGHYDHLKDQPESQSDFYAFLNQPQESKVWKYKPIHTEFSDSNRNAKIHKIMPHLYFPDHKYSLWIDGSVTILFPFTVARLAEIYLADSDLAVFRHPDRHCIYEEANACIQRRLDDADVIRNQIQRYTREGYPQNVGLSECTILLRRHTDGVKKFNEAWWKEIQNGSKRDQISFNYVARKHGIKINYFPGHLRRDGFLFRRENHFKQNR